MYLIFHPTNSPFLRGIIQIPVEAVVALFDLWDIAKH